MTRMLVALQAGIVALGVGLAGAALAQSYDSGGTTGQEGMTGESSGPALSRKSETKRSTHRATRKHHTRTAHRAESKKATKRSSAKARDRQKAPADTSGEGSDMSAPESQGSQE